MYAKLIQIVQRHDNDAKSVELVCVLLSDLLSKEKIHEAAWLWRLLNDLVCQQRVEADGIARYITWSASAFQKAMEESRYKQWIQLLSQSTLINLQRHARECIERQRYGPEVDWDALQSALSRFKAGALYQALAKEPIPFSEGFHDCMRSLLSEVRRSTRAEAANDTAGLETILASRQSLCLQWLLEIIQARLVVLTQHRRDQAPVSGLLAALAHLGRWLWFDKANCPSLPSQTDRQTLETLRQNYLITVKDYDFTNPEVSSAIIANRTFSQGIRAWFGQVFAEAETVLGPPPWAYSIVAWGSLSRDMSCLYSDIDYSILLAPLPETMSTAKREALAPIVARYFRLLLLQVHYRVEALGESQVPKGICLDNGGTYAPQVMDVDDHFLEKWTTQALWQAHCHELASAQLYSLIMPAFVYGSREPIHDWDGARVYRDYLQQVQAALAKEDWRQALAAAQHEAHDSDEQAPFSSDALPVVVDLKEDAVTPWLVQVLDACLAQGIPLTPPFDETACRAAMAAADLKALQSQLPLYHLTDLIATLGTQLKLTLAFIQAAQEAVCGLEILRVRLQAHYGQQIKPAYVRLADGEAKAEVQKLASFFAARCPAKQQKQLYDLRHYDKAYAFLIQQANAVCWPWRFWNHELIQHQRSTRSPLCVYLQHVSKPSAEATITLWYQWQFKAMQQGQLPDVTLLRELYSFAPQALPAFSQGNTVPSTPTGKAWQMWLHILPQDNGRSPWLLQQQRFLQAITQANSLQSLSAWLHGVKALAVLWTKDTSSTFQQTLELLSQAKQLHPAIKAALHFAHRITLTSTFSLPSGIRGLTLSDQIHIVTDCILKPLQHHLNTALPAWVMDIKASAPLATLPKGFDPIKAWCQLPEAEKTSWPLLDYLAHQPDKSGQCLVWRFDSQRWQQTLLNITEKIKRDEKSQRGYAKFNRVAVRWVYQGMLYQRALKPEYQQQCVNTKGQFDDTKSGTQAEGKRTTIALYDDQQTLIAYAKSHPELPGVQYTTDQLLWRLTGFGCLSTVCHVIPMHAPTTSYPVLFTQPAGNTILDELKAGKDLNALDKLLDTGSVMLKGWATLLAGLEDDKKDNVCVEGYQVVPRIPQQSSETRYRLVSIDTDHAWSPPLTPAKQVAIKSVGLCSDHLLAPLPHWVKQRIKQLEPEAVIRAWLADCERWSSFIGPHKKPSLFSQPEKWATLEKRQGLSRFWGQPTAKDFSFVLSVFEHGSITILYQQLHRLHRIISNDFITTGWEACHYLAPRLMPFYQTVNQTHAGLASRFDALSTDYITERIAVERTTTQTANASRQPKQIMTHQSSRMASAWLATTLQPQYVKRSSTLTTAKGLLEAVANHYFLTPDKVTHQELDPIHRYYQRLRPLQQRLDQQRIDAFIQGFARLDPKQTAAIREALLLTLNWKPLKPAQQIQLLKIMAGSDYRQLDFKDCTELSDKLLNNILIHCEGLTHLRLADTPKVTQSGIDAVIQYAGTTLQHLHLINVPKLVALKPIKKGISRTRYTFNQLYRLNLHECAELKTVVLKEAILERITLYDCPQLEHLSLADGNEADKTIIVLKNKAETWKNCKSQFARGRLDPGYAVTWANKGAVLGQLLGRHEEAIAYHDQALALGPKYKTARDNKGFDYLHKVVLTAYYYHHLGVINQALSINLPTTSYVIGVAYDVIKIKDTKNNIHKLQIWEVAENERFFSTTRSYFRVAALMIAVYNPVYHSYDAIYANLKNYFDAFEKPDKPFIIIGSNYAPQQIHLDFAWDKMRAFINEHSQYRSYVHTIDPEDMEFESEWLKQWLLAILMQTEQPQAVAKQQRERSNRFKTLYPQGWQVAQHFMHRAYKKEELIRILTPFNFFQLDRFFNHIIKYANTSDWDEKAYCENAKVVVFIALAKHNLSVAQRAQYLIRHHQLIDFNKEREVDKTLWRTMTEIFVFALRQNLTAAEYNFINHFFNDVDLIKLAPVLGTNQSLAQLDLSHNAFTNQGVSALCKALVVNKSLISLNISHNQLSDACASSIINWLQRSDTIQIVSLRKNKFSAKMLIKMVNAWVGSSSLKELLLLASYDIFLIDVIKKAVRPSIIDLDCENDAFLIVLLYVVQKYACPITDLTLIWSTISDTGIEALRDYFQWQQKFINIKLARCKLNDSYFIQLCTGLQHNSALTTLNFSENKITGNGLNALSDVWVEQRGQLTTLNLSANQLGAEAILPLRTILRQNPINFLELNNNPLGDKTVAKLLPYLFYHPSLSQLNLSKVKITSAMFALLAQWPKPRSVNSLDISENDFSASNESMILALADLLKYMTTLNLNRCQLTNKTLIAAINMIGKQDENRIQKFVLRYNKFTTDIFPNLCKLIKSCPHLTNLDLYGFKIKKDYYNAAFIAALKNSKITVLKMDFGSDSKFDEGIKAVLKENALKDESDIQDNNEEHISLKLG